MTGKWRVDTLRKHRGVEVWVLRRKYRLLPLVYEGEKVGRVAYDRESSPNRSRSFPEQLEIAMERARQRCAVLNNWRP